MRNCQQFVEKKESHSFRKIADNCSIYSNDSVSQTNSKDMMILCIMYFASQFVNVDRKSFVYFLSNYF